MINGQDSVKYKFRLKKNAYGVFERNSHVVYLDGLPSRNQLFVVKASQRKAVSQARLVDIDHCQAEFGDSQVFLVSGTHDPEPTTLLCSCNGVFTDRFTFRLNFPRMRLPQEPDDLLQEIKLTSSGHRTGTAFVF